MKQEIIRIDLKGVNCYLGKQGDNFILFDSAGHTIMDPVFTNRREALIKELEKAGCKPGNLKLIVLTHGDIDHVANAVYIREKYYTKIAMHPEDLPLVETVTVAKMMQSFHFQSMMLKIIFQIMKPKIKKVSAKILMDFEPFHPDILLQEGDSLAPYGFNAKVLHIPGHTDGSIGILTETGDLIAGDTFANLKRPGISPNAADFAVLSQSVARLKAMSVDNVYPGHGLPFKMSDLK